jgi:hypothetical protein
VCRDKVIFLSVFRERCQKKINFKELEKIVKSLMNRERFKNKKIKNNQFKKFKNQKILLKE